MLSNSNNLMARYLEKNCFTAKKSTESLLLKESSEQKSDQRNTPLEQDSALKDKVVTITGSGEPRVFGF